MTRTQRYYEYKNRVRNLPLGTDASVLEKADLILKGMRDLAFTERMNEILANEKERGNLHVRRSKIFSSFCAEDYQDEHRRGTIIEALKNVSDAIKKSEGYQSKEI